jgi:hypothetical protein
VAGTAASGAALADVKVGAADAEELDPFGLRAADGDGGDGGDGGGLESTVSGGDGVEAVAGRAVAVALADAAELGGGGNASGLALEALASTGTGVCGSDPGPVEPVEASSANTAVAGGRGRESDDVDLGAPDAAGALPDAASGRRAKGGGSPGSVPTERSLFWMIGIVGLVGSLSSSRPSGSSKAKGR